MGLRGGLILVCVALSGCVSGNPASKCLKNADTGQTICEGDRASEKDVIAAMLSGPTPTTARQGSVTQLRDIGGVSQTMETKVTGPATMTQTYTYGTPPAAAAAKPKAVAVPTTTRRACRNTMVGGDGYACIPI